MNSSRIKELKRSAADEPAKPHSSPTVCKFPNIKIPPKLPEKTTFAKPFSGRLLARTVSSTAPAAPKPAPAVAAAEPKASEPVTATAPEPKPGLTEAADITAEGQKLLPDVAPPSTPPRTQLILLEAWRSPVKTQHQLLPLNVTASQTTLDDLTKPPPVDMMMTATTTISIQGVDLTKPPPMNATTTLFIGRVELTKPPPIDLMKTTCGGPTDLAIQTLPGFPTNDTTFLEWTMESSSSDRDKKSAELQDRNRLDPETSVVQLNFVKSQLGRWVLFFQFYSCFFPSLYHFF